MHEGSRERLAILSSHPVQYYAPLFREMARSLDIEVFFAHKASPKQQAAAGFGTAFDWDVDLLDGYSSSFLRNVARDSGTSHFSGCDTPDVHQVLMAGRFRALLVTGWHLKSYWQGIWAAKRLGIPTMVRGDSQLGTPRSKAKSLAKEMTYPGLLRLFDAALYVGRNSRAYYEHYNYPARRLFRSPHCVDNDRFSAGATPEARLALRRQLGLTSDDRALLFAGKLVAFKRPLDVVEAAAVLRSQGIRAHVIVAGSGPLETDMRACAESRGVPLHLLGFRNQTEMPAAYAAADVLVLPSTGRETWGLVCNEALASGTPIVVSDAVGCAPDLAANSQVGRTFRLGDTVELARKVAELLLAPPSIKALRHASESHSLAIAADGVETAFRHLTSVRDRHMPGNRGA
jgi:glycosyltransferase involved in cell wall biosynthesis